MRNIFLSSLYCLLPAAALAAVPQSQLHAGTAGSDGADEGYPYRELLYEDFSKFTAGSEERPSANTVNDQLQEIPASKTITPGWQGVEIYQAGGVAYQGIGGTLFTPDIDLSQNGGEFRVSFRMKLASGSPEGWANVVHKNISTQHSVKLTEEWQTVTYNFTGGVANDYLAIRGVDMTDVSASRVKVFVDDIVIEVPAPEVESPRGVGFYDFDGTGFTARWQALPGADSYQLRVYSMSGNTPVYIPGEFATTETEYSFSGLDELWNGYYLQVRAISGTKNSPWSAPVLVEGVAVPAELNTGLNPGGGFTLAWSPVANARKYEVRAFVEHTAADDERFPLVDTDFAFVKPVDLGNQTDVGFDELPGWFFGCADLQEGFIGIQGAFAYMGYAAQIESPRLDLTSSGGKVSFKFVCKNDDARTGVAVALFSHQGGDYILVDEHRVADLAKNWYTVSGSLQGGGDNCILAIIPTRSGNVYVDDLEVFQNVKAGAVVRRQAATGETAATSYSFSDIPHDAVDRICCSVRAVGVSADGQRWLNGRDSPMAYPYGESSLTVNTCDDNSGVVYTVTSSGIAVSSQSATLYDLSGRLIATSADDAGTCTLPLPESGIYVLAAGGRTAKIAIR